MPCCIFANSIVIPKNTPIPCEQSQTYLTSEDNEQSIEVEITQGEDMDPKYVDVIGRISFEVPPNRPAGCEITVTYADGQQEVVNGGDLFYWPPGHTVKVGQNAEVVLFSPQHEHGQVMAHMQRKLAGEG